MFSLNALTYKYRGASVPALDDVSFSVPSGALLGLLGVNGAGKSTLVSTLVGAVHAYQGEVSIGGESPYLGRSDVAYVPQEYAFYGQLSIKQNIDYFAALVHGSDSLTKRQAIDRALFQCRLTAIADKLPVACSGGEKRRLNLAIALLKTPTLLILDEPTANVDPHARSEIVSIVRELNRSGVTVVYTSHLLGEVQSLCDTLALLHKGQLLEFGRARDLLGHQSQKLRIEVEQALSPGDLEQAFPGGVSELETNRVCVIDMERAQLSHRVALERIEALDVKIHSVQTQTNSLEDLFLSLIREEEIHD